MAVVWSWLCANIGTIIICAVLIAVVVAVVAWMIHDKKQGKSSCGGNCSSCGMGCHSQKK